MSPAAARRYAEQVATQYGYTLDDILSARRNRKLARVRWSIMAVLRRDGMSLPQIGGIMNRDSSSVLHGLRQLEKAA